VLDLTRVIAGPVCTRLLGALGADVLRIDPPGHLDMAPGALADTILGKRSAFLDLGSAGGLATLHRLLEGADVVVHGYRPGSLDRFGLRPDDLAGRHPGLVVVHLDAWGHRGPWAQRRGFDSIVQAACGIAATESTDGIAPGALPCQLLDHGTGYLAAAAALDGLRRQASGGGTHIRRLSLARTAWWLTNLASGLASPPRPHASPTNPPWLVEVAGATETVTAVAPPGSFDGRPLTWPGKLSGYGDSPTTWSAD
jgi:crotonobetainyl-CoA:carnitine CoA-transferase CaiB-like acyl-CoA transferase